MIHRTDRPVAGTIRGRREGSARVGCAVGLEARDDLGRDPAAEDLDLAQQLHLVDADQRDGVAVTLGPAGPADAMDVILGTIGSSKLTTCGRASISSPRAAISVATRTANRPALKSARARTRCGWLLLPWIAVALMPSFSSWSARRLAPCLVRVKTSAWSMRPDVMR